MKITCLLENTSSRPDILSQHGLSLLIETNSHRILFDMGQTDLFAQNAALLGIDLKAVDLAVLSHGHYDHGGGLPTFLEINENAPVYVSRHAFDRFYNGTEKYIGLDRTLQGHPRLILTDGETKIGDGLTLFSCNHLPRPNFLGCFGLTRRNDDGSFTDDPFLHEQYLLIEENGKRVLVSGCSHKGILDIASWFSPDLLIGGFHVSKMPLNEKLAELSRSLSDFKTYFYTCHCTGREQYEFMKKYISRLDYLACGDKIDI
jgi:7,8-dihydropterin-6-yl-methyl-4-(beta-D-ribofuranosyl)aminobenzene 5'-phosphate synthase